MKRTSHFKFVWGILLGLACAIAHGDALGVDAQPVFEGRVGGAGGILPLTVTVTNDGPDAVGAVRIFTDYGSWEYPVELPRGAHKKITAYPVAGYSMLRYQLDTNRGSVDRQMPPVGMDAVANSYLLISDVSGELAFMRTQAEPQENGAQRSTSSDAYVKPESAPARPVGYSGITVLVMGSGSERLSDESVQAIKAWTLGGGTVVFMGGASAPALMDARWRNLLPLTGFHARTLSRSSVLSQLGDTDSPSAFTIQDATPSVANNVRREGDAILFADRPFGLGKVGVMTFNLLDRPLSSWDGRRAVFNRMVRVGDSVRGRQFLNSYTLSNERQVFYSPGMTTYSVPAPAMAMAPGAAAAAGGPLSALPPMPGRPMAQSGSLGDDPFAAKLPPSGTVMWILGAYFVLVVPVNFLILRWLKRGELAWITAPAISLVFAGILFRFAQGLYDAQMSVATSGIVVAQEGVPEGFFRGQSQMFFPRAGAYDLGLKNVDTVGMMSQEDYSYGSSRSVNELNAVDIGEVKVPALPATNLAFREMNYTQQHIPAGGWLTTEVKSLGKNKVEVDIVNTSPYKLTSCRLITGINFNQLGDLNPGQRQKVQAEVGLTNPQLDIQMNDIRGVLGRTGGIAVTGWIDGFRPGPQIGKEVAGRRDISFVFFAHQTANSRSVAR